MGEARAHSIFAPSASKRWTTCPGSIKLSEKAPPQKDTPEAIEGTDGHYLFEQMLRHNLANKWTPWQGAEWRGFALPSGKKASKIMVGHVGTSVDYVWRHYQANGGKLFIEQRLKMPKIDPRMWGSGDVIQITNVRTLHVFDLKYGFWLIEPDGNTQCMSYAIGALTEWRDLIDLTKPVTVHICQPRAKHKDGHNRSAKFSIDELIEFGKLAKRAIKESDKPGARLVDGEHCTFCPAEFICPKLNSLGRMAFKKGVTNAIR